jgi:hypothetical protein
MLGNNTLATNIILLVKTWERGGGKKTRLNIFHFHFYIYLTLDLYLNYKPIRPLEF